MKKTKNVYPKGWDEQRVKAVIDYYDKQTEDKAVREYESSEGEPSQTVMSVPTQLVPAIRAFISSAAAKRQPARQGCRRPVESRNRRQMV